MKHEGRRRICVALTATLSALCGPSAFAQQPSPDITERPGRFVQGQTASSQSAAVDAPLDEPVTATYVGADIRTVVGELFGEIADIPYSIAPDVSAQVTFMVRNVSSRLELIDTVRTAARPFGIAVIDRGDVVALTRATASIDAPVAGAAIMPGEQVAAGVGAALLTPRHISPAQLAPLLQPFSGGASIAHVDNDRRFLILVGEASALNSLSGAAAMFDVDWHGQVSKGVFPLAHVTPAALARELRPLLGPSAALVDLIPSPRLSSLIVLARSPDAMRTVAGLISELDVPSATTHAGVLVYRVRHVGAETLAASLRDIGPAAASVTGASVGSAAGPPGGFPASVEPRELSGSVGGASDAVSSYAVAANAALNAVIVRGDPGQLAEARALLETLDQVAPQILIEAAIVEVTLNEELQYGVNWRGVQDQLTATFTDTESGAVASRFPGLAISYVNVDIEAAINLLASVSHVEVVSRPSVMALNNQTAELQVGDQVPIVTQTAVSVTDPAAPIVSQTVYRDTGVILSVTPSVRAGGVIEIAVDQEVSQVARTTSSGIDSPTIQQRRIESRLSVPSGQSVALGGLISTTRSRITNGVPLLKDIPLLGRLFRSDGTITQRTELIVFLTPRVMREPQEAVDATDALRAAFLRLEEEFGRR